MLKKQENITAATNKINGFKKRKIPGSPNIINVTPNTESIIRNKKNHTNNLLTVFKARLLFSVMPLPPHENWLINN